VKELEWEAKIVVIRILFPRLLILKLEVRLAWKQTEEADKKIRNHTGTE
jgi:hypothetical protein